MRIIHPNNEGGLTVLIPAPKFLDQLEGSEESKLQHIGHKDLPQEPHSRLSRMTMSPQIVRSVMLGSM